jgi:hypothetical protein
MCIFENCVLLGYYAASSDNFLPTFRDKLLVPSPDFSTLRIGPIGCPEMSAKNYHFSLGNNPEEHSSQLFRGGGLKSRICILTHTSFCELNFMLTTCRPKFAYVVRTTLKVE